MKNSMIAVALATAAGITLSPSALTQTNPDLGTLRLRGIAGASAQLNSFLGSEIGGLPLGATVAAARKDATDFEAQQKILMQQADGLQAEVDQYVKTYIVANDTAILRPTKKVVQLSTLAVEGYAHAQSQLSGREMGKVFSKAKQINAKTLEAALTVELANIPKKQLKQWGEQIAKKDGAVLDAVLMSSPNYLKKKVVDAAGEQAALIIRSQLQQQLGPAVAAALKLSSNEASKLRKVADDGLVVLQQTAVVVNALSNSGKLLDESKIYMSELRSATVGLTAISNYVENQVRVGNNFTPVQQAALKSAIQLGQQFIQGKPVSSADVAASIEGAGISIPDKKGLSQTFDNLSNLRKPEALATGLNQVSGYLTLASSLGVKIDSKVTKTVSSLQTAASVAMSFATGNYLGAVSGALGLFGGGDMLSGGSGVDPEAAARHAEVMSALNDIKLMQQQTLKAIDDLSAQLARATEQILTRLDGVQDSVDYLIAIEQFHQINRALSQCRAFVDSAKSTASMSQGYFPSYAQRKAHFDARAQPNAPVFNTCEKLLIEHLALVNAGTQPSLPPTLWNVTQLRSARRDRTQKPALWQFDRETYYPMVAYTVLALDLGTLTPSADADFSFKPCADRFIGALALAPSSTNEVNYAKLQCADNAIPAASGEGLKLASEGFSGQYLRAGPLFEVPIHAGLVSELAYYQVFLHSYNPLIIDAGDAKKTLYSETELAGGSFNGLREQGGMTRLKSAFDIVNVALAQQTMLAGVYVATHASGILKQHQFGRTAGPLSAPLKAAAKDGCAPDQQYASAPYHTTVCLLLRHPEFARNVAMQLVLCETSAAQMTFEEYADMFDKNVASVADVTVSFPTIYDFMVQRDNKWYISIGTGTGDPLLLPLPSSAALRDGTVAYPEIVRPLLASRASIVQELAGSKATASSAALWTSVGQSKAEYLPATPGMQAKTSPGETQ